MKKPTSALGLAALVLLTTAACSSGEGDTPAGGNDSGRSPAMEHIHGIGVDPKDGTVYAGTHHGLFRIEDGSATLVAGRVQDFMGFTVAGPDHFLASGHPGEGQDGPPAVGLIESTDAGENWRELSLGGEADFHALEYRHGRVYGLDAGSGRLMVSTDKRSWEQLSSYPIADLAVSPEDPDVLIATSQQGLTHSTDGGRTFEIVRSAPLMLFVGWGDDGALAGVTPEGIVYTADDPAAEWTERGSVGGQPEAMTVRSAKEIYVAANATVLLSSDGGSTFTPTTR